MTASEEEEKYFRKLEAERREQKRLELERAAKAAADKAAIASELGASSSVADRLAALGFDSDTARVIDVLPLVHVAWADGSVSFRERARITEILESRGITADSNAGLLISSLLEERPSQEFLDESMSILREIVGSDEGKSRTLIDLCVKVAESSRSIFGFAKFSDAERATVESLAAQLNASAVEEFHRKMG